MIIMIQLLAIIGNWTLGSFVIIDLIAATTNAFNGAILAKRKDHHRNWTVVGIILIAVIGGIGGGVTRDILLNDIPSALKNPWYILLCLVAAILALAVTKNMAPKSIQKLFDYMAAFSLPWYAIIGAQKALGMDLPLFTVVLIGVVGPTAGRYFIDLTSGVTPQHFTRGAWFVGTAALAAVLYIICDALGLGLWPATLVAWVIAFVFRLLALHFNWNEPEPWEQERFHEANDDKAVQVAE
jgi:uncharacterized membrane protein YeiH